MKAVTKTILPRGFSRSVRVDMKTTVPRGFSRWMSGHEDDCRERVLQMDESI